MRVCYFGNYDSEYPRNRNIIKGLELNDVKVIKVIDRTPGIIKYYKLIKKFWPLRNDFDLVIVGFPGQIIVPFAKLITRKPVIFDLHLSYYDSIVLERKNYKPGSIMAGYYYFLDWLACSMADKILLDTKEHVKYLAKFLHQEPDKFIVVYHGIDDTIFKPIEKPKRNDNKLIISFHGYIQLLNGMDLVIKAMKELENEDMELWVIGGGPEYGNIQKLSKELMLNNVKFFPPMKRDELIKKIGQADVGLGFFSKSQKIDRVIANKVYELISLKIPVLMGESKATAEHFKHKEHIYFVERGSVDAIVKALRELKGNKELRERIANNACNYLRENFVPKCLGEKLIIELKKIDYEKSRKK